MESPYLSTARILDVEQVSGRVTWRSPSNIAIVKYWGKHGVQLPRNPSISFTLDKSFTETSITYKAASDIDKGRIMFFQFNGEEDNSFIERVQRYFDGLNAYFPFLRQLDTRIETQNSFPHSTGIASSASAFSALALCLCSMERQLGLATLTDDDFFHKASYIARLGSGSASRSVYPLAAAWGRIPAISSSSEEEAVGLEQTISDAFNELHDSIIIVSNTVKSVSSSQGHKSMEDHDYANARYQQARNNCSRLLVSLKNNDWNLFGRICEQEALTLHAMMMSAVEPFILLQPNSLKIIQLVREYRKTMQQPLYFTIDAGPNIHLLYPSHIKSDVQSFIADVLSPYYESVIHDKVGNGPVLLD